ncbi:jmjC domain-containing protein 8 isoform X1 [Haemorhous mexicanus]|uniref:jmjC domain-containing protein 8 isoform X1 n=1 Tax=Haemorhous mexicanus TaxID=30427 RepID=UPI0028BDA2CD|nr:jmjC domain-containing protein 8 isoform X1 [Haemorhous mexicanus]
MSPCMPGIVVPAVSGAGPDGGGGAAAAAAAAAAGLGPARRLHRPSGRRLAGGHGAGGTTLHRGTSRCLPHLFPLPAAVRLLPAGDPRWGHGQFGVPSSLHPGEAAGGLRAPPGAAQHGQHLLVPQSGCAVPGVRGAPAEAAGPGPAGQRNPLLLRGQQLHRVGSPLPALRAPSLPHPGHQPRLQLWDRSTTPPLPPGSGSGVPFHWHGPGFSEVIFGRKRWFLYPPDRTPHFHPNESTLAWLQHTYPTLPPAQRPLECTLRPGEVLYFPDRWWHATLNLDTSVFISTFLG